MRLKFVRFKGDKSMIQGSCQLIECHDALLWVQLFYECYTDRKAEATIRVGMANSEELASPRDRLGHSSLSVTER